MPRRISPSQLRSRLRQAQSKIRQAEAKHKQAINKYNQAMRTNISKARAHNARVRASRDRLKRELQKLARTASEPQYVTLRTSVETVQRSYTILEQRANAELYDERFNRFLDLSEREAANSASVMNALEGEVPGNESEEAPPASKIDHIFDAISQDARDRWRGALYSLSPRNPDAARHFCTSARELLTEILERFAPDNEVKSNLPDCELTPQGKPTRRAKIRFLLYMQGASDDAVTDFVEKDMDNVVQLFRVFNDGTHGSSSHFDHRQLLAIRARVEGAVSFLWGIITGAAFGAS